MDTPICDFVRQYAASAPLRLHMPGHKGEPVLGPERLDITEIDGADVLYHDDGVIRRSQENAAALFGSGTTLYSAEGSSLCIRAMLYLAMLYAKAEGKRPCIAAGRNAHKTFLTAAALLDLDILWLFPKERENMLSCPVSAGELEELLSAPEPPAAVYVTAPDYLGNLLELQSLAEICHRRGALLLVDNAHGAYLRFLPRSLHPMDLGADLCCDSAHKTLPVLTGGAYLHISSSAPAMLREQGRNALSLFASTSPSYLILQSLDAANRYLAEGYRESLASFAATASALKQRLADQGWTLAGEEPLKLTLSTKGRGYTGTELAGILREQGIVCEFADPDFAVMMLTPEVGVAALERVEDALSAIPERPPILEGPPVLPLPVKVTPPRKALFACQEQLLVHEAQGRVLACASVGCPPAIPILVCGERIDEQAVRCFAYYGIKNCFVTKE